MKTKNTMNLLVHTKNLKVLYYHVFMNSVSVLPSDMCLCESMATKWVYAMLRLVDVGGKMRGGAEVRAVSAALERHPDIYNIFNFINIQQEKVHILIGRKVSCSGRVDMYIMIGMRIRVEVDVRYSYLIGQELDRYLGCGGASFGVDSRTCKLFVENPVSEAKEFVLWCMEIVKEMDDVMEIGVALLV